MSTKVRIVLDAEQISGTSPAEFVVEALKVKVDMDQALTAIIDFDSDRETLAKYMSDEDIEKRKANLERMYVAFRSKYEGIIKAGIRSADSIYCVEDLSIMTELDETDEEV